MAEAVALLQRKFLTISISTEEIQGLVGAKVEIAELQSALNIAVDGYYGPDTNNAALRALKDGALSLPENQDFAEFAKQMSQFFVAANANAPAGQPSRPPYMLERPTADRISAGVKALPLFNDSVDTVQQDIRLRSPSLIENVHNLEVEMRRVTGEILREGALRTTDPDEDGFATREYYLATKIADAHTEMDRIRAQSIDLNEEARTVIAQEVQMLEMERDFLRTSIAAEQANFQKYYQAAMDLRQDPDVAAALANDTLKHHPEEYEHYIDALANVEMAGQELADTLKDALAEEQALRNQFGIPPDEDISSAAVDAAREKLSAAQVTLTEMETAYFDQASYTQNKFLLESYIDGTLASVTSISAMTKRIEAIEGQLTDLAVRNKSFEADIKSIQDAPNFLPDGTPVQVGISAPFGEVTVSDLPNIPGTIIAPPPAVKAEDIPDRAGQWTRGFLNEAQLEMQRATEALRAEQEKLLEQQRRDEELNSQLRENRLEQTLVTAKYAQTLEQVDNLTDQIADLEKQKLAIESLYIDVQESDMRPPAYIQDHYKIDMINDHIASLSAMVTTYQDKAALLETENADLVTASQSISDVIAQNNQALSNQQGIADGQRLALDVAGNKFARAAEITDTLEQEAAVINLTLAPLDDAAVAALGLNADDLKISVWARDITVDAQFQASREGDTVVITEAPVLTDDPALSENDILQELGIATPEEVAIKKLLADSPIDHLDLSQGSPALFMAQEIVSQSSSHLAIDAPDESDGALVWNADIRNLDFSTANLSQKQHIAARALIADAHNLSYEDVSKISDTALSAFMMGEPLQDGSLSSDILNNPFNIPADEDPAVIDVKTDSIRTMIKEMPDLSQQDVYALFGKARAIALTDDLENIGLDVINPNDPFGTIDRIQAQNIATFKGRDLNFELTYPWAYFSQVAANESLLTEDESLAAGFSSLLTGDLRDAEGFEQSLRQWRADIEAVTPRDLLQARADHWQSVYDTQTEAGNATEAALAKQYLAMNLNGLGVIDRMDHLLSALEDKEAVLNNPSYRLSAEEGLSTAQTLQAVIAVRNDVAYDALDTADVQAYLDTGVVSSALQEAGINPDNILNLSASLRLSDATEEAEAGAIITKESLMLDMIRRGGFDEDMAPDQIVSMLSLRTAMMSDHDISVDGDTGTTYDHAIERLENIARIDRQLDTARTIVADQGANVMTPEGIASSLIAIREGLDYNDIIDDAAIRAADLSAFVPTFNARNFNINFADVAADNDNDGRTVKQRLADAGVDANNPLASATDIAPQTEIVEVAGLSLKGPDRLQEFLARDVSTLPVEAAFTDLSSLMPAGGINPDDTLEGLFQAVYANGVTDFAPSTWREQVLESYSLERFIGATEYDGQEYEIPQALNADLEVLRGEASYFQTTIDRINRLTQVDMTLAEIEDLLDKDQAARIDGINIENLLSPERLEQITYQSNSLYIERIDLNKLLEREEIASANSSPEIIRLTEEIAHAQSQIEIYDAQITEKENANIFSKLWDSVSRKEEGYKDPYEEKARLNEVIAQARIDMDLERRRLRITELETHLDDTNTLIAEKTRLLEDANDRMLLADRYRAQLSAADSALAVENNPKFQSDAAFFTQTLAHVTDAGRQQFIARTLIAAGNGNLSYDDVHITDAQAAYLFKYGTLPQSIPGVNSANPFNLNPSVEISSGNLTDNFSDNAAFFKTKFFIDNVLNTDEFKQRFYADPTKAAYHAIYTSHWISNQEIGTASQDVASRLQNYVDLNTQLEDSIASTSRAKLLLQEAQDKIAEMTGPGSHLTAKDQAGWTLRANMAAVMAHRNQGLSFNDAFTAVSAMTDDNIRTLLSKGRLEITTAAAPLVVDDITPTFPAAVNSGYVPR